MKSLYQKLEDWIFASWEYVKPHVGEPFVLTAKIDKSTPNGCHCAIQDFVAVPFAKVEDEFRKQLAAMVGTEDSNRPMAWHRVSLCCGKGGVHDDMPNHEAKGVWGEAMAALKGFMQQNYAVSAAQDARVKAGLAEVVPPGQIKQPSKNAAGEELQQITPDHVLLPRIVTALPSGRRSVPQVLYPFPEVECLRNPEMKVVAVRVQLPLAPAAVRTAASLLSMTVLPRRMRLVLHMPNVTDPNADTDAHNAPLFVALTRCVDAADVAFTTATKLHGDIFCPRQPMRGMLKAIAELNGAEAEHVSVYHCKAGVRGNGNAQGHARDSNVHDERLDAQHAAGWFGQPEHVGAQLAAYVAPDEDDPFA